MLALVAGPEALLLLLPLGLFPGWRKWGADTSQERRVTDSAGRAAGLPAARGSFEGGSFDAI